MKTLSVMQPWAWLLVTGIKEVENRTWATSHRGPLLIHASKTWDSKALCHLHKIGRIDIAAKINRHFQLGHGDVAKLNPDEFGTIIGLVDLYDCTRNSVSGDEWAQPGCWHWCVTWVEEFTTPIPARGRLGLWEHSL